MASSAAKGARKLQLFVGNLTWNVSRNDVTEYFSKYGGVKKTSLIFDKRTGLSKGICFVEFANKGAYHRVLNQSDHFLSGTKLSVHEMDEIGGGGQKAPEAKEQN